MNTGPQPSTYWDDVQVAYRLNLSPVQVRRWARRALIPCFALPHDIFLFDVAELTAWVASHRRGPVWTPRGEDSGR